MSTLTVSIVSFAAQNGQVAYAVKIYSMDSVPSHYDCELLVSLWSQFLSSIHEILHSFL